MVAWKSVDNGKHQTSIGYKVKSSGKTSKPSGWFNVNAMSAAKSVLKHHTTLAVSKMTPNASDLRSEAIGGTENSLHWVLDVSFREDESRIRKDNAPQNFAVLRHVDFNLLKRETSLKKSMKSRQLKAGWENDYLAKVLNA